MIGSILNLFKKKETLLVGVITIHYQTKNVLFQSDWKPEQATYRCYEREDGKRTLDVQLTSAISDKSRLRAFATAGLLYDWSMRKAHILAMPTYEDIKSGRKDVWTKQCNAEANLN